MEVALIKIGNSKGIRLPKAILEKYNILDKIEMTLEEGYIILSQNLVLEKTGKRLLPKCMKKAMTSC